MKIVTILLGVFLVWNATAAATSLEEIDPAQLTLSHATLSGRIHLNNTDMQLRPPITISVSVQNVGATPSVPGEIYVTYGASGEIAPFKTEYLKLRLIKPLETAIYVFSKQQELPLSPLIFLKDDGETRVYEAHILIEGKDKIIAQQNLTVNMSYNAFSSTSKSYAKWVPSPKSMAPGMPHRAIPTPYSKRIVPLDSSAPTVVVHPMIPNTGGTTRVRAGNLPLPVH